MKIRGYKKNPVKRIDKLKPSTIKIITTVERKSMSAIP
jgi:hypothetical protein